MKILELFTKEQCKKIIEDIELNKEYLGISTEHGVERISSYEIDCKHLSKHVTNMINNVIDKKIRPITGGEVGMVFGVKYTLDTKPDPKIPAPTPAEVPNPYTPESPAVPK